MLMGKLLAMRIFRHFKVVSIIKSIWCVDEVVRVEKVGENTFKIIFGFKDDKWKIFNRRPWNLDGSLLILKEWKAGEGIGEVNFNTSDFFIQVHSLPPNLMNQANVVKIREHIGTIVLEFTCRCVVGDKYLSFKVEIRVDAPLPACYFLKRVIEEETWIQFKFERLSDFCYRCRRLMHITGKCIEEGITTVTTGTRIITKLYGP